MPSLSYKLTDDRNKLNQQLRVSNYSSRGTSIYGGSNNSGSSGKGYWLAFQNQNYLPDMCLECDKKDLCDGGCREAAHVMFGKINDIDPLLYGDAKTNALYIRS